VSHDLRTPLSNVSMAIDALADGGLSALERRRLSSMAQRAVERMARLIQDILDVTRIEQGGLSLEMGDHDAAQLAAEVIETIKIAAERGGVHVEVDVPAGLGVVRVDRARLAQVFQNLLSNALRFTPPGGCIRVSAQTDGDAICY